MQFIKELFTRRNQKTTTSAAPVPRFNKKVLAFSDLHGETNYPEAQPDLVVLMGDIPYWAVQDIDQKYACPKVGVLGNHDGPDYFDGTSVVNIHSSVRKVNGITIAGFGGCPRYNSKPHGQYTQEDAYQFVSQLVYVDLFIAHANIVYNPTITDKARIGFHAFNEYIERYQPLYFLHGHLHDPKRTSLGRTTIVSIHHHDMIDL
jgi:predicted phosphodiesterase